jgi:hypothetical protein
MFKLALQYNCCTLPIMGIRFYGILEITPLQLSKHQYSPGTYLVSLTAYSKNEKKKDNITKSIIVTSPTPQPPIYSVL